MPESFSGGNGSGTLARVAAAHPSDFHTAFGEDLSGTFVTTTTDVQHTVGERKD